MRESPDIRLLVSFRDDPKIKKLERRCGRESLISLIYLWLFARENRVDGVLSGMDVEDIEIAADWQGDPGQLVSTLVELRLIDVEDGVYQIHDWEDNQPWAAGQKERSKRASIHGLMSKLGLTREQAEHEYERRQTGVSSTSSQLVVSKQSTSSLTPSPSPSPIHLQEEHTSYACDETSQAGSPPELSPTRDRIRQKPEDSSPIVATFQCDGKPAEFQLRQSKVDQWKQTYKTIDVDEQIALARQWCEDNPSRRKTATGMTKFLNSWLNRAVNRPRGRDSPPLADDLSDDRRPIAKRLRFYVGSAYFKTQKEAELACRNAQKPYSEIREVIE